MHNHDKDESNRDKSKTVRAIFCGTPEIAVPSLRALGEIAEIVGVVCQPDRPAGRGMKLSPPAVKVAAQAAGWEVYQPYKVRDGELERWMRDRHADLALVIAYGRILTSQVLSAPRLGCVNLHASLLPKYRGAAPIQRALMDGQEVTGVCLMQMDAGMDTGPVLTRRELPIEPSDDAGTLAEKLGQLAAAITREDVPRFFRDELHAQPQDHDQATYAPPLTKEDVVLDFRADSAKLVAQIRGLSPKPGAVCFYDEARTKRLKIARAEVVPQGQVKIPGLRPGVVATLADVLGQVGDQLLVGTGDGSIMVREGQVEGKKPQTGAELLRGRAVSPGQQLFGKP